MRTSIRRTVLAVAAMGLILPCLIGCGRRSGEEQALMDQLAGNWSYRTPSREYTTIEEIQFTDDGKFTRTTFAEIRGQIRMLYIKPMTMDIAIEPTDRAKLKALENEGYKPTKETGTYSVTIGDKGETILFKPKTALRPMSAQETSGQKIVVAPTGNQATIGGKVYKREEAPIAQ